MAMRIYQGNMPRFGFSRHSSILAHSAGRS
jgi:hypothetical protein